MAARRASRPYKNHNSAFIKTVQDLANAGSVIDMDRQVRDYLTTMQDPTLLSIEDTIRADGGALTLEEVQQKFVDIIEGRKADAMSQATKHRTVKTAVVKYPKKVNNKKAQGASGNKGKKWEGKKRKASQVNERLSDEEVSLLKVSNPDNWFLTTKSIPPKVFNTMSQKEKKLMRKFRESETRAVKAVRTEGVTQSTRGTVPDNSPVPGAQIGPIVLLTADQAYPIIQMLNQSTLNTHPGLTMPTVQFGHAVHQLKDVAHQNE
jgi:hypothetical protein